MRLCLCSLSHVQLFGTLWTVAHQASLSMDSPIKNIRVGCRFLSGGSSRPRDQTCISCICLHWKADFFLSLSLLGSPSMRGAATKPLHSAAPLPDPPPPPTTRPHASSSPTWQVLLKLTIADVVVQGHRRATRGICSTTELHPLFKD